MPAKVSLSELLIRIARKFEQNRQRYSAEIRADIRRVKTLPPMPAQLKKDDILILAWLWRAVARGRPLTVDPLEVLNEIYPHPGKALQHLDNVVTLLKYNILDSQVKKVTANAQNRIVRVNIDKEMLFETEIFFTREFFHCLLSNKQKALSGPTSYKHNKEFVNDWFAYVAALEELGWARFRSRNNSAPQRELYMVAKAWQKIERRLPRTRQKFPLQLISEEYQLDHNEQIILMYLLQQYLGGHNTEIDELKQMISRDRHEMVKNQAYFEDDAPLIAHAMIEKDDNTGFKSMAEIQICPAVVSQLLDDKPLKAQNHLTEMLRGCEVLTLVHPQKSMQDLVLNQEKKRMLTAGIDQYRRDVGQTLRQWGLSTDQHGSGLLILLYGPPGTGKTCCAHGIAHYLHKPLLTTDISRLLSCWVGESEQNVHRLFQTYTKIHKRVANPPVLLLNEADQFLTRRGAANRSTDRMYNQMQNLFLEAFENFPGVLVCTTNLRENLDPAFSRRFHLKLLFPFPAVKEREQLWALHLPETIPGSNRIDTAGLAKAYPLNGGQIAVVVKNAATEAAGRSGKHRTLRQADLEKYCQLEMASTFGEKRKKIGFR